MTKYWIVPALALALAGCGSKDDTGDSGTTTGTATGTATAGTATGTTAGDTSIITAFDPPGCAGGSQWSYGLDLDGWSATNFMNTFETGTANVTYRWNEELVLDSIVADPATDTETIGLTLTPITELSQYVPNENTLYQCGFHDGPNASNTYVARIFDLDGNFSDCGFGVDPNAPANAVASVKNGTAWDSGASTDPSGDWQTQFANCDTWEFYNN